MKTLPRPPFFEIGIKNYIFGDEVLKLAKAADAASIKYNIDVILTTPYVDIRRIAENTERLIVMAPYMDTLTPGRGVADILPEAIKAAGAKGVMVNHCERPMTLADVRKTMERANELGLFTFACADSIAETRAIAQLHPDIINPEPTELIGTSDSSTMDYVKASNQAVKDIYPDILVEQAAGISSADQVYDVIMAGSDAAGSASGIMNAPDPIGLLEDMICSVRKASNDLSKNYDLIGETR